MNKTIIRHLIVEQKLSQCNKGLALGLLVIYNGPREDK